jgi:hypothetical protein
MASTNSWPARIQIEMTGGQVFNVQHPGGDGVFSQGLPLTREVQKGGDTSKAPVPSSC